jgi:hypothetical protein
MSVRALQWIFISILYFALFGIHHWLDPYFFSKFLETQKYDLFLKRDHRYIMVVDCIMASTMQIFLIEHKQP